MTTLYPENVSERRKSMIRELTQGHESATQLKVLLQKPLQADGSLTAKELAANILRSFTETLSFLTSSEAGGEVDRDPAISGENGSPVVASCNDRRSEDSSQSKKRSTPATKDRRGCYQRRKTAPSWTLVSQSTNDHHAWRKYGQKEIQNSKFPRSYFRCTRKCEGCRAVKQVQRIQEDPELYRTTYIEFHTCKEAPDMVTESGNWESLSVPETKVSNEQRHGPFSSSTPTIKQEYPKEDTPLSDITDNLDPSTLWSDFKDFELSEPSIMPSKMASFEVESVDFDAGFPFD